VTDKIVLTSCVIDQGDILRDFIEWHLSLGVDCLLIEDLGSTDDSCKILKQMARCGNVEWFPKTNVVVGNHADALANLARDKYQADWVIYCDADEFLCPLGASLEDVLLDAKREKLTVLNVPRFNMTGSPPRAGERATEALTLRIERPTEATEEQKRSGNLPVPYQFIAIPPHTIVWSSAFQEYTAGAHGAIPLSGQIGSAGRLRILHYNMRSYDRFEKKVANARDWLANNKDLPPSWGWHWRRWILLHEAGELEVEYYQQFVTLERMEKLVRDGTCVPDETVASWAKHRRQGSRVLLNRRFLARLFGEKRGNLT
jgi:Glycosyl transferase family 2